jgi:non-heme chloroperoxidase
MEVKSALQCVHGANSISKSCAAGGEGGLTRLIEERTTTAIGHGGIRLHVRDFGPESAPAIVFVHGWSQSYLSWKRQLHSDLGRDYRLIAFDLRGHGQSEVAQSAEAYKRTAAWAGDVAAVIDKCGLVRPVLVGWSHGAFVCCDYLRQYGDSRLAGVVLSSWAVRIDENPAGNAYIGPGFTDFFQGSISSDLAVNIEAVRNFVSACVPHPANVADREEILCYNMIVPPFVREATGRHEACDNTGILGGLTVPLLAIHGLQDTVVRPEALDLVTAANPAAKVSVYQDSAHAPFLDCADRFNEELREFASQAFQR